MIKHQWVGKMAALLMALSVLFVGVGYFIPSMYESFSGSPTPPYVLAMDKTKVLDIQIIADEKQWEDMLNNATAEDYIPVTIVIDGAKVKHAGIRPKGNSSLSMVARDDSTDRYSFKIEFDQYVTGQTWLGLDKLVLNNMLGDTTYMKEYLSYDLMDYSGVQSPLYTFANISINGETWGLYLAVEALEDSYAKRVYGNDHGKLYKPESMGARGNGQMNEFMEGLQGANLPEGFPPMADIPVPMWGQGPRQANNNVPADFGRGFGGSSNGISLQYTDDAISSYSAIFENAVFKSTERDYIRVIDALKKLNAGEDLENVVDIEATLRYFAAHTVLVNLDSYVSNMGHNYYLYEKNGQLTMLPWDFNLAFGGFQSGNASSVVNFPIDTPVSGVNLEDRPILAKLLEIPEYLELYHSYLREIVDGYFTSGLFSQTIDSLDAVISAFVESDPTSFYDFAAYQRGIAELKKLGMARAESIDGQLNGIIPSTTVGQNANPNARIDASTIDLSTLGSMGGMGGGARMEGIATRERQQGGFGGFEGVPGGADTRLPGNVSRERNIAFAQETTGSRNIPSNITPFHNAEAWMVIGSSTVLLLGGLLFVSRYKRRNIG